MSRRFAGFFYNVPAAYRISYLSNIGLSIPRCSHFFMGS